MTSGKKSPCPFQDSQAHTFGSTSACKITIPMPLLLVVEDVGWWRGNNRGKCNEPYRTGMNRRHCPEDYHALVSLANLLDMGILIGFVGCEWDKSNILAHVPSATWMGENWDNRENIGPWMEEAAHILNNNGDRLEIALHALGHEYWGNGTLLRSEFHSSRGTMRPEGDIRAHLDYFGKIMAQHNLGDFPAAFIPPALNHSFGNGTAGFQKILADFGITCVTTIFDRAKAFSPPHHPHITWECGVVLLERGEAPVPWNAISCVPEHPVHGPVIPLHWANLLHADPQRNIEIINRWASHIKKNRDPFEHTSAKDSRSCLTQYAYKSLTKITVSENTAELDTSELKKLPENTLGSTFLVNIKSPVNTHLKWSIKGGGIITRTTTPHTNNGAITTLEISPDRKGEKIIFYS